MNVKRWLHLGELAIVIAILALFLLTDIEAVRFHEDESNRIASSDTFERFITGDFDNDLWKESYWTLTQPPLSRYAIGVGRTLGGYAANELNGPWRWTRDFAWNQRNGNVPEPGLLWWSRLPMAWLAVVSGLALFYLVRAVAGSVGGFAVLLLFVTNPYLDTTLGQALGESPLLAFLLLAALAAHYTLPGWGQAVASVGDSPSRLARPLSGLALTGVLCGLAGAAKLNGLAAAVAAAGLVLMATLTEPGLASLGRRLWLTLVGVVVVLGSAYAFFVAVNPFLYPDPINRTIAMFDHRVEEMQKQFEDFPPSRIANLEDRLVIVPKRVLEDDASIRYPDLPRLPNAIRLNLFLTAIGLSYMAWLTWQWATSRRVSNAAAVILAFGLVSAGPALLTPLDWPRYYLFPVIFSTICIAVAIGAIAQAVAYWWRRRSITPTTTSQTAQSR